MPTDDPSIQAGELRHTVTFLRGVQTGSPPVQTWTTAASIFAAGIHASIVPQRGSESPGSEAAPPNVQMFEITTRAPRSLAGVRPKMRIIWVDAAQGNLLRIFEIDDVTDVGMRRRKLVMTCREVRA